MLRVANSKKPKYIVYENVKNIVNSSFKPTFDLFINELEEYGYKVYWKVLNSKDYNSAQSRERVFVVAIRKDIDNGFKFPIGRDSSIKIKDILEDKVDEKYYLKEERCKSLLSTMKDKLKESKNGIIQVNNPLFSQQRVYMVEGKAPTICTGNNGGGQEPCKIIVLNNRIMLLEDIKKNIK